MWIEGRDFVVVPDKTSTSLQLKPFKWSDSNNRFEPLTNKVLEFENEDNYIDHSITKDRKLIVFTTSKKTYIIGGFDKVGEVGGFMEVILHIDRDDIKMNRVSEDRKYIFASLNNGIQIYVNCEVDR